MKINKCIYEDINIELKDGHKLKTIASLNPIYDDRLFKIFRKPEPISYEINATNAEITLKLEFSDAFRALKYFMSMVDRLNGGHTLEGYLDNHPITNNKTK